MVNWYCTSSISYCNSFYCCRSYVPYKFWYWTWFKRNSWCSSSSWRSFRCRSPWIIWYYYKFSTYAIRLSISLFRCSLFTNSTAYVCFTCLCIYCKGLHDTSCLIYSPSVYCWFLNGWCICAWCNFLCSWLWSWNK